jgi:hypothetical protein
MTQGRYDGVRDEPNRLIVFRWQKPTGDEPKPMPFQNYTPKTQTSLSGSDSSETDDSDANDQPNSAELSEDFRAALMNPGPIELRNSEHARMIRAHDPRDRE